MTGHRKELPIDHFGVTTRERTRSHAPIGLHEPEAEGEAPRTGVLFAAVGVLGAVVMLAGLPAAAGMTLLFGVPAPISFAIEVAATALMCVAALVAAWAVARRRLARPSANGIAIDFD